MFSSSSTFFPMGNSLSGVRSLDPSLHLTKGMGLPTATQVMFRLAPFFTSYFASGLMVKCGGTRRTAKSFDNIHQEINATFVPTYLWHKVEQSRSILYQQSLLQHIHIFPEKYVSISNVKSYFLGLPDQILQQLQFSRNLELTNYRNIYFVSILGR